MPLFLNIISACVSVGMLAWAGNKQVLSIDLEGKVRNGFVLALRLVI
jgi:hypothetical protein